jgi:hypothetical protein
VRTATARALASGDRIVDVRSEHPGFAPEAQGAGRIERLRGPEGPGRLGVMEGPRVPVALIEIRLRVRLGRGGDGPGQLAEIIGKGRLLLGARRGRTARQITRRPRVRCAWPASAALAAELAPLCGRDRNAIRRWWSRAEGAPAGCRVRRADTRRPGVLPRAAGPPLPWCRGERRASSHGNVEETKGPWRFSHSGVGPSQAGIAGTNGSIAGLAENRSQAEVLIRPGACSTETSPAGRN